MARWWVTSATPRPDQPLLARSSTTAALPFHATHPLTALPSPCPRSRSYKVALKFWRPAGALDDRVASLFRRELTALCSLSHPYIVQLVGLSTEGLELGHGAHAGRHPAPAAGAGGRWHRGGCPQRCHLA